MKKLRITIVVELDLPDSAIVADVVGEQALRVGDAIVRPDIEFLELSSASEKSSTWVPPSEATYDLIQGSIAASRTTIDPV